MSLVFPWRSERDKLLGAVGLIVLFVLGLSLSSYPFVAGTLVLFGGLAILDGLWWRTGLEPAMRRWRRWAGLVVAFGWLAAGCWVAGRPELRAPAVGPAALVLFAEYFWLALAYVLFQLLGRWLTQGVTIVLMIAVTFWFLTGPFNLRSVRTISPASLSKAPGHVALSKHIDDWLEARRGKIEAASEPYPVFIASAEGGGIRAACWTAGVLCAIQDAEPEFVDHFLGVSGVSGGSLGAATFVALVRESQLGNLDRSRGTADAGPLQSYADEILGRDFLSPVLATMLIADVAACLTHNDWAEDRATVLEKAFEIGWRDAIRTDTFGGPMNALWVEESRHRVPALFMNSTEADSGRRIVNSHVVLDPDLSSALCLPTSMPPHSLRLSTAVLLSARFPAISPIGSLGDESTSGALHVVDGGYVDNSGTVTATELAAALNASAARLGLGGRVRIVAILITDDPIIPGDLPSHADRQNRAGLAGTAAGAVLAPFETLDSVRVALAKKHLAKFEALVRASGGEVLDGFALRASKIEFPLGWMLSSATRSALTQQIKSLKSDPHGHFQRVQNILDMRR